MMKFTNLLLLTGLLAVSAPAIAADGEATEPVTVTINSSTGTFTAGSGNYRSQWTSTATPGVVLDCGVNNFLNGVTGDLQYFTGTRAPYAISITSKSDRYYVSSYSFKFKLVSDGSVKVSANGAAEVAATTEYQSASAEVPLGTDASIGVTGDNKGIYLNDFKVTLTPVPNYEEPVYDMLSTTIENGEFSEWTTWFNLQLTTNGYSIYGDGENMIGLNALHQSYQGGEDHQWCFVKQDDGTYKIYNRADGTAKVLAAPKGGTGYPRMMAEGNSGYCYTWNVIPAKSKSDGTAINSYYNNKFPFYLALSDNPNAILNNFGGEGNLKFWTGGYDDGSVFVPVLIEGKYAINLDNGYLTRDGAINTENAWQSMWHLNGNVALTFGTSKNNMTTTTGNVLTGNLQLATGGSSCSYNFGFPDSDCYISDLSLTATTAGADGAATLAIGSHTYELAKAEPVDIKITEITHSTPMGFFITASNTTKDNVVISDMVVTVKRYVRSYEEGVVVFHKGSNHQRRIPAIAVTGKSGHLVAVYDYRWCNGDLGGGNIDLQIATSKDHGATWSEPDFARNAAGDPVTEYNHQWTKGSNWSEVQANATEAWDAAWGDAAICGDRESDKVLMIAVGGPTGFWGSRRNNAQSAIRWTSEDGGKTWSAPENITEKIYSLFDGEPGFGKIDGMFFGSGRIAQSRHIKVGDYYRMYSVISSQNNGGNTRNWVLYTDDLGATWHILGGYDTCPVPSAADEPKAEELPDGSVLLAARRNGGNRNFNIFRYTNPTTGEGRWDSPVGTDMGMGRINACDGEIYILPVRNTLTQDTLFMALQSFPYGGGRNMVSIAYKPLTEGADFDVPNDFASWEGRYQVSPGSSAYTTMILNHKGHMGFFYEEQRTGVYDGVYKNLPLELITEGKYEYCPDTDNAIAQRLTASMVEHRMSNYSGSNADAVAAAGQAYLAEPTYANYVAFNRAEYGFSGTADSYDFDYSTPIWPLVETVVEVESIAIDPATVSLETGKTQTLTLVITPADAETEETAVWASDNESVAAVSQTGEVTAVAVGTATITVTLGDFTATCQVTVTPGIEDGIAEIGTADGIRQVYDLQGRKVANPAHGLYIVNGRKTVVK